MLKWLKPAIRGVVDDFIKSDMHKMQEGITELQTQGKVLESILQELRERTIRLEHSLQETSAKQAQIDQLMQAVWRKGLSSVAIRPPGPEDEKLFYRLINSEQGS